LDATRDIGWIDETRDRTGPRPLPVRGFVPMGYGMYVRVLFPFQAPDGSLVSWKQAARRVGMELTAQAGIEELSTAVFECDEELVPVDTLGEEGIGVLAAVLEGPLGPTEPCTCLYSSVEASDVDHPDLHRVEGSLRGEDVIVCAGTISETLNFYANYVWPSDRRWIYAKIIDSLGSGILGCDRATGQKILDSDVIEAFEVSALDDASFLFPKWGE